MCVPISPTLFRRLTSPPACANGEVAPFMGHNAYNSSYNHFCITITHISPIQIFTLESHPRRRLRWSGRRKAKNMVRVKRIWRFRYGPPTHLEGLHRKVRILSHITYASIWAIHPSHPSTHHHTLECQRPPWVFIASTLFSNPKFDPDFWSFSRWATYSKGAFKEGVSLSVDDELNRWQKYSYGCNEWVPHPSISLPFHPSFSIPFHRIPAHRIHNKFPR